MKPDLDSELEILRIEWTPQPDPKTRPGARWILLDAMSAIGVAAPITAYELRDSAPLVEVTRAVAAQSSSGEDAASADEILALLVQLSKSFGKTIVMVTHDPHAAEYARSLYHLEKGTCFRRSPRPQFNLPLIIAER
jgi:hypothetical protein